MGLCLVHQVGADGGQGGDLAHRTLDRFRGRGGFGPQAVQVLPQPGTEAMQPAGPLEPLAGLLIGHLLRGERGAPFQLQHLQRAGDDAELIAPGDIGNRDIATVMGELADRRGQVAQGTDHAQRHEDEGQQQDRGRQQPALGQSPADLAGLLGDGGERLPDLDEPSHIADLPDADRRIGMAVVTIDTALRHAVGDRDAQHGAGPAALDGAERGRPVFGQRFPGCRLESVEVLAPLPLRPGERADQPDAVATGVEPRRVVEEKGRGDGNGVRI